MPDLMSARRRTTAAACLTVAAAAVTAGCTASTPSPAKPSTGALSVLTAQAGKAAFKAGEPVVIALTLTSRAKAACRVAGVPDGVVTISSLTRDGTAVVPALSEGDYVDGFTAVIRGNSVSVDPGKAVSTALTSESRLLPSSVQAANDRASIARWPVGQPGAYVAVLTYRMPPIELPSPACPVSADPVSVPFTVSGS